MSFAGPERLQDRLEFVAFARPEEVFLAIRPVSVAVHHQFVFTGRKVESLGPGQQTDVSFAPAQVMLAQIPGETFYHRFRGKFGRLAY